MIRRTSLENGNTWFVFRESNAIFKLLGPTIQALLLRVGLPQPGSALILSNASLIIFTRYVTEVGVVDVGVSVGSGVNGVNVDTGADIRAGADVGAAVRDGAGADAGAAVEGGMGFGVGVGLGVAVCGSGAPTLLHSAQTIPSGGISI